MAPVPHVISGLGLRKFQADGFLLTRVYISGMGRHRLDWAGSGQRQVASACEWGNERSGSIKCGGFIDHLNVQSASQEGLCSMELMLFTDTGSCWVNTSPRVNEWVWENYRKIFRGERRSIRRQTFSQLSFSNHRSRIDWLGIELRSLKSEGQAADSSSHDVATTILNLSGMDIQVITADITWCRNASREFPDPVSLEFLEMVTRVYVTPVLRLWYKLFVNTLIPNSFRVIKLRRMRWAGHVARMGERRGVYRVLVGKSEGNNHLGDPGVNGRRILRWIFRKWDVRVWTGSIWPSIGTGVGHLWMR